MGKRRAARGVGVLLVLAGVAGGCGSEERSAPLTADAPAHRARDDDAPAAQGSADIALDQPSVLDLLDDRGDHGTFTITLPGGDVGEATHTVTGRYVVTTSGLTYTVVDLDLPLVQVEVDRLLAMTERFDSLEPMLAETFLSADTVVTDQLQLGLADLVLGSGMLGAGGYLAAFPWLAFTAIEAGDLDMCERAVHDLRAAVRRRLVEDGPTLGASWTPDPAHLGGDELAAVEAACDGVEPVEGQPATFTIEDDALRIESRGKVVLTAEVRPGAGEPPAIDAATPASLFDGFGAFFLAIDRCGELPWMYSNFAAANSYTSPDEPSYIGPGPFGGTPVCEAEVPDQ